MTEQSHTQAAADQAKHYMSRQEVADSPTAQDKVKCAPAVLNKAIRIYVVSRTVEEALAETCRTRGKRNFERQACQTGSPAKNLHSIGASKRSMHCRRFAAERKRLSPSRTIYSERPNSRRDTSLQYAGHDTLGYTRDHSTIKSAHLPCIVADASLNLLRAY